jgi:hypothetical protein
LNADRGESVVLAGTVLPGRAIAPPYASDARCVIWAAAHNDDPDVTASGGLAFDLRADDGRELAVETAGAAAVLPVRLRFTFPRIVTAAARSAPADGRPPRTALDQEMRRVCWLAVGDRVTVAGRLLGGGAPFRGRQMMAAISIRIEGTSAPTLEVRSLEPADPEY